MKDLLQRYPGNPVITVKDIPVRANCVFNSGAVVHGGEIVMLLSTWVSDWTPQFLVGRSKDGVHFTVEPRVMVTPPAGHPYVPHEGIFDTRITPLEGWYYVTWNVASRLGGRIMLGRTRDFAEIEVLDYITGPDHRNCVLFPEKIGGQYYRLERPNINDAGDIYISSSPDLIHWGRTRMVLERNSRYWESAKIGPGAPPIKTDKGWLCIYHGCRQSMNGFAYHAGAFVLDLATPGKIIGKLQDCLLWPQELYERVGNCNNVIFPTAAVVHGGPDELKVYYGAADTCIGLATGSLSELVDACLAAGPPQSK
jgi:predicted GH43/DUF377 family glycosyl hydrolase